MKKKRIAILTVISIMIVSGLTGCGQKVTAENLLDGAYGSKKVESMDADLSMNADADIDISDLLEDTAEQSADAAGSTTMNFKVAMDTMSMPAVPEMMQTVLQQWIFLVCHKRFR